ncbi:hypothetical protein [Nocardia cyriacigeorgica]|uniref:hypothetical protein n=1 Tax=Nocardia cyriacigeorgica TaxID=135487 RepID=UPI000CE9AE87|nr:hypothetical protein [Nocardia cyriacigeorgica]PPJ02271.1 hypothetical protein C5E43_26910 [Nocardia cyriacigeorgica]
MKSHRLLIILLTVLTVVVAAAFVVTITGTERSATPAPARDGSQHGSPVPTAPSEPSSEPQRPPTIDAFGNRLDIPSSEAGTPLPQEPRARPDPASPDYLRTAPARLHWQRGWGGAALPVSASDGPTHIRDGIASGFARTPQGAALAAHDALARALAAPEGIWQTAVRTRFYGGGNALVARFSLARARTPDAARYVVVPDGVRIQPGYRDDLAVVEFAVRSDVGYGVSVWPMVWVDGDWRVRVPDNIETLWQRGTSTPTLTGFGTWKTTS